MLCDELGTLLTSISNATNTVFGDNALVTHVVHSPWYDSMGIILDITVTVLEDRYEEEELEKLVRIFDNLVYNPLFNSDFILSKVKIEMVYR